MLLSAILFANNLQKSKFKLQNIKKLLKQKRRLMFQIFFIFYYLLDLTSFYQSEWKYVVYPIRDYIAFTQNKSNSWAFFFTKCYAIVKLLVIT